MLDEMARDNQPVAGQGRPGLRQQMLVQRQARRRDAFEIRADIVEAAGPSVRSILATRRGHAVGARIMVEGFLTIIDIERRIILCVAADHKPIGRGRVFSLEAVAIILAGRVRLIGIPFGVAACLIKQRVFLDLLGNEAFDLQIAQRQQFDRLLELRRHDQRLALAEIEARSERHWQAR